MTTAEDVKRAVNAPTDDESKDDGILTLRQGPSIPDWYVIEKRHHDGRGWLEPMDIGGVRGLAFNCSARFSDADVEGTRVEMLDIAEGIEKRERRSHYRCAVDFDFTRGVAKFCSPRNTMGKHGEVVLSEADKLAREIRRKLDGGGDR